MRKESLRKEPELAFSLTTFLIEKTWEGESSVCFFQLSRTYPAKHIYWRRMETLEKKKRTENIEPLVKASRPRDENIWFLLKRNCSCWTLPKVTVKYWGENTLKKSLVLWCASWVPSPPPPRCTLSTLIALIISLQKLCLWRQMLIIFPVVTGLGLRNQLYHHYH